MKTRFHLPPASDSKAVEEALKYHLQSAEDELRQHAWGWTRTHWFLQGVRRLSIWGSSGNIPTPHYMDAAGERVIRVDKAAAVLQTEIGRLMGIDISPALDRRPGVGLDTLRGNALTQVALDNFWERFDHATFKLSLLYNIITYGTVGVGAFETAPGQGGVYGATLALIPSWELYPLPAGPTGVDEVAGVTWSRWVSLDWLKDHYKGLLKFPSSTDAKKLNVLEVPAGGTVHVNWSPAPRATTGGTAGGGGRSPAGDSQRGSTIARSAANASTHTVKHVRMSESWVYGEDHSCLRWCIMLGDHLALDVDYTNPKTRESMGFEGNDYPIAPVHIARYLSVGSFYARGLVERIVDLEREFELLLGEMLQDLREANRLRMLMLPMSSGVNVRNLELHKRNRVMPFQPDYAAPHIKPDILVPPTLGDIPGKTANLVMSIIGDLTNQGPMLGGRPPGRMDSAGGAAILADQQNIPLAGVAESLEGAMSGVWKAVAGILRRRLTSEDNLTLTRLDESVIGVQFDRNTGKVSLSKNALPNPQTLPITIRHKIPRSKSRIKEDLDDQLAKGVISKIQYQIAVYKEGLDLPGIPRAPYETYATAWMENIIMFGDGQTGDAPTSNIEADIHPIHLMVLMEFMASPLWRLASPEVQMRFLTHKEQHLDQMGAIDAFPENMAALDQFGEVGPPNPIAAEMMQGQLPPTPGQPPPGDMMTPMMG